MKELIIFGNTELAELAHFYFSHDSEYKVAGFSVDGEYMNQSSFKGLPIVPFEEVSGAFPQEEYSMFIAVGYTHMNAIRKMKYLQAKALNYELANYISSKAQTWPQTQTGDNCMIMEGTTVMPYCKIGNNVLVWVNSILSHHSVIEDHVCITSDCAIGGMVHIEEQAFIGLNSTIRQGLTVGRKSIIAAGANLLEDAKENGVYIGNPAHLSSMNSSEISL